MDTLIGNRMIMTASTIVQTLETTYNNGTSDWIGMAEVRVGTGHRAGADQRLDYWAMATIPSKRFERITFEIKVSRSDFLHELQQPLKRRQGLLLSNSFYFIAPEGLINPDEIPVECGLMEIAPIPNSSHYMLIPILSAPWRDTTAPPMSFWASMVRAEQRRSRKVQQQCD